MRVDEKTKKLRQWKKRILITAWITYASFYLIRINFAVAIPGIIEEFGISKTEIGMVLTALFFAYAIGQFVNGQLGDKFGARKLVFIGLLVSSVINIIFGFTSGFLAGMMLLWALNGYFQSMGWSPIVKTISCWFPRKTRGGASGILGSSYIFGSAASWILAGFIVGALGWRWAFFLPAIITIIIAFHWFLRIRESCEDEGFEPVEKDTVRYQGVRHSLSLIIKDKGIWLASFALFGLNIVRYGFLDWAPTYFFEVQKATISLAAFKALIFPLAGVAGAIFAGWASDKLFKNQRAPVAVIMLLGLALFGFIFPNIPQDAWILSLIVLAIIGFLTFGPHMLIVTAIPMDFGTKERAASAAGFIDGWGYIGAALTGVGTGFLLDNFGWNPAFYFWISGAIIAAILMVILWRYKRET